MTSAEPKGITTYLLFDTIKCCVLASVACLHHADRASQRSILKTFVRPSVLFVRSLFVFGRSSLVLVGSSVGWFGWFCVLFSGCLLIRRVAFTDFTAVCAVCAAIRFAVLAFFRFLSFRRHIRCWAAAAAAVAGSCRLNSKKYERAFLSLVRWAAPSCSRRGCADRRRPSRGKHEQQPTSNNQQQQQTCFWSIVEKMGNELGTLGESGQSLTGAPSMQDIFAIPPPSSSAPGLKFGILGAKVGRLVAWLVVGLLLPSRACIML